MPKLFPIPSTQITNTINIDFEVSEGPKYYFRNIIWTGNYIYTDKQLAAVLGINKGDVYNKELIDQKTSV